MIFLLVNAVFVAQPYNYYNILGIYVQILVVKLDTTVT